MIRRQEDVTAIDTYSTLQLGIIGLLAIVLIIQPHLVAVINTLMRSPTRYLMLLYGLGIVSYIWSALPNLSGYFAFQGLILIIAIAVYFYHQMRAGRFERAILISSLVLLILNVIGHIGLKGFSFSLGSWHTNSYSAVAAMLAAYCIGEQASRESLALKENRRLVWISLWIALFFLGLGTSGGSNIAFVAGIVVAAFYSGRPLFKIVTIFLFAIILIMDMYFADLIFSLLLPGKSMEDLETATGRAHLWELYIQMIEEKPWLGWGFAAPERIGSIYTTNTHNIVLGVAASLGVSGLALLILFMVGLAKRAWFGRYKKYCGGAVCALVVGLVNGMSIGFLASGSGPVFLAFVIWSVVFVLKPLAITRYPQAQSQRPTRSYFNGQAGARRPAHVPYP